METETTVQDTATETPTADAQAAQATTPELGKDGKPFDAARAQALIEKLQAENKEARAAAKKLAEYEAAEKKRTDAEKSDLEKALSARDEALKTAQLAHKKLVAIKYHLPDEFADRIKGDTLEEMDADAEKLAAALPKPKEPERVVINPTNMANGPVRGTDAQWRDYLYNNGPLPGA